MSYAIDGFFGGKDITKVGPNVIRLIQSYMKDNERALNTPMYETVKFGAVHYERFMSAYGIKQREFEKFAKQHDILCQGWHVVNDPINLALYLSYVHSGKREFLDFLGIKFMTSMMWKYYDRDGSLNPDIMRFVVEGVDQYGKPIMTNKWLLKTEGSTTRYVKALVDTFINDFLGKKNKGKTLNEDETIINNINSLSDRINGSMRKLRGIYADYKDFRMYEQGDVRNEENNISVDNESAKLTTLRNLISESIINGMDVQSLKDVNGGKFYPVISNMYENDRAKILEYSKYLVDFYIEKIGNAIFTGMEYRFTQTVTKSKGRDDTIVFNLATKYGVRDRLFPKVFVDMHVLMIRKLISRVN